MTRKTLSLILAIALVTNVCAAFAEEAITTDLPIVTEPVTLKFVGIRDAGFEDGFANVPAVARWQEETGITIEWTTYTSEQWASQKNLIIASNDLPDAFAGGNPIDADLTQWAADGVLVPLRELSEEYMPRFHQIMEQHPEYLKSFVDSEGEFYAFPMHYDIDFGSRNRVLYFSKSVVEQVADLTYTTNEYFDTVDGSYTTDEFYELLKAIKENTDAIPFSVDYINALGFVYWAFGCNESDNLIYVEDGQVKTFVDEESWVEATQYLHKLYDEKLLDQELATQSWDTYRAKLMEEGKIGTTLMWSGLIAVDDFTDMDDPRYADWAGVVPLIGPDGTQQYQKGASGVAAKGSFAICATSENVELCCRFMDYLYNEDNSYQLSYGDYGSGLIPEDDGTITQNFEDSGQSGLFLNTMFITTSEMNSRINYAPATAMAIEVGALLAKPFHQNWTFPSMSISSEYAERIAELQTDLTEYYARKRAEFILEGGAAEGVEEMVDTLYDIGLAEYIEIYQTLFDIYNSL